MRNTARLRALTVRDEKKIKRRRGIMGLSFLCIFFFCLEGEKGVTRENVGGFVGL